MLSLQPIETKHYKIYVKHENHQHFISTALHHLWIITDVQRKETKANVTFSQQLNIPCTHYIQRYIRIQTFSTYDASGIHKRHFVDGEITNPRLQALQSRPFYAIHSCFMFLCPEVLKG
jgi:hypothetical protein